MGKFKGTFERANLKREPSDTPTEDPTDGFSKASKNIEIFLKRAVKNGYIASYEAHPIKQVLGNLTHQTRFDIKGHYFDERFMSKNAKPDSDFRIYVRRNRAGENSVLFMTSNDMSRRALFSFERERRQYLNNMRDSAFPVDNMRKKITHESFQKIADFLGFTPDRFKASARRVWVIQKRGLEPF